MGKKKKLRYRPIRQNETLDISVALSQASALLDQAAKRAMYEDDPYLLMDIAERWIDIAKVFGMEEVPDEHLDTDSETQYGFSADKKEDEVIDEDE